MRRGGALVLAALALSGCSVIEGLRGGSPPAAEAPPAAPVAAAAPELEPVAARVAGARVAPAPRPPERPATPTQLVARAGTLGREGQVGAARDLYRQVIDEHPQDPARPHALWGLAQLLADPTGPRHDYRASVATFDRLLVEHPRSELAPDARLWRAVLAELIAREDDHARLRAQSGEEIARLRSQLQRLKRIDVELERKR
jgi:TolA-binding protein